MARNKVVYNGETLIDLTGDTVEADKVLSGYTFHDRSGAIDEGECTFDADTSDATAAASEILTGKSAYVGGSKVNGSMNNRGTWNDTIDDKDDVITIPVGFHDGSGSVQISATEKAKIIGANIKAGVVMLGETGTYTGEGVNAQAKNATPSASQQVITPDAGYDYLSQVTIAAIPYTETLNSAGGYTVTIG
ncbi:MAG: hypothetical protein IKE23_12075 [Exiguobacterium sp.]|nr:hypothetical protein [Exiguobacterium sp.]